MRQTKNGLKQLRSEPWETVSPNKYWQRSPAKPRCTACGLKIRSPRHSDGAHHKAKALLKLA